MLLSSFVAGALAIIFQKASVPDVATAMIREGVAKAVRDRGRYSPFTMTPPYTMVLKLKTEASIYNGSFFPGARRTGDWELTFTSDDLLQVMYAFNVMNR